jgi:hypothetical protein
MLTVRIKNRPTIGNLQGPFEAGILNRTTWVEYSKHLDKIVAYLGPDKSPDDVLKQDVENVRAYLIEHYNYPAERARRAISMASSYWNWMFDKGFATGNPFHRRMTMPAIKQEVNVIVE